MNILYLHGMGGGGDSRIPSILNDALAGTVARVVVRTYDFDPEIAAGQIHAWMEELEPQLVIGESLGSVHAIRQRGIRHLFVSPALGAPVYLGMMAWLAPIPGMQWLFHKIWQPKEGDRQPLKFDFRTLRKYPAHRKAALGNTPGSGSSDYFFAFFGTRDHYRKSGVVSVRRWKRIFGPDSCAIYEGTHFMEEEWIRSMLVPKIREVLGLETV